MYVDTETGEELVKAADWMAGLQSGKNSVDKKEVSMKATGKQDKGLDSNQIPEVKKDEDKMSVENQEVVVKSQEELQEIIKAAIEQDRAAQEEIRKAAEVEAQTVEVIKSIYSLAEHNAVELVKCLLAVEGHEVILKALMDSQEAVVKAKEEAAAQVEEIKKEFGKQESVEGEEIQDKVEKGAKKGLDLNAFVAKHKKA
jgi:thioesterase domain-containing protein